MQAFMDRKALQKQVRKYATPDHTKSILQIFTSFVPYIAIWAIMITFMQVGFPYWVTLLLVPVAAVFLTRTFIIFHDCCHHSFFRSSKANKIVGHIFGILAFTPYESWGHAHMIHHSTVADLGRRGIGDVWTMTVKEYKAASKWTRFLYRLVRNPFVMFVLGPIGVFFLKHRFYDKSTTRAGKVSTIVTNVALLALLVAAHFTIGIKTFLLIQLPIMWFAGMVGIWLFYVQHQFDPTHWYPHEDWDYLTAALHASSYYKLPKVLQWMSGNIGLHHVHHVNAFVPNYRLQECLDNTPFLQQVKPLTLWESFKTVKMNLWDEEQDKLVSFGSLKKTG
ncbi:fatty acid desaturase [bacterium]|nr:fatty acid desaturase [bacterium]